MAGDDAKDGERPFLNTKEAAAWLRLTKNTLEKMRSTAPGRFTANTADMFATTSKISSIIRTRTSGGRPPMTPRLAHLRGKAAVLAVISVSIVLTIVALAPHPPLIVYNASGSAPFGFYRVESRLPERGETAVIEPPPLIGLMLVSRGILPPSVPLIKQIAAVGGDEVCRSKKSGGVLSINGKVVAETFEKGRDGRPLPAWEGCMRLIDGEFFLLQPHPLSFDSRYFGPVMRCDVIGVARPLWTWNPDG